MAGTVRDLFLAVRVVDRATGPLRRIAADVNRLSAAGGFGSAERSAAIEKRMETNLARQARLRQRITDLTAADGVTQLRFAQRRNDLADRHERRQLRIRELDRQSTGLQEKLTRNRFLQERTFISAAQRRADFEAAADEKMARLRRQHAESIARIEAAGPAAIQAQQTALTNVRRAEERVEAAAQQTYRARQKLGPLLSAEGYSAELEAQYAAQGLNIREAFNQETVMAERNVDRLAQAEANRVREAVIAQTALQKAYADVGITTRGERPEEIERRMARTEAARRRGPIGITPADTAERARQLRAAEAALLLQADEMAVKQGLAQRQLGKTATERAILTAEERKAALTAEILHAEVTKLAAAYGEEATALEANNAAQGRFNRMQSLAKTQQYARGLEHLGHVATITGLGITAGFGMAAKAAADFTTQSVLAATQARRVGGAQAEGVPQVVAKAARIQNAVLGMMQRGGAIAPAEEQLSAVYRVLSGTNATLGNSITLLQEFNKVATANYGLVSLEEVASAGVVIMNNFHKSVAQMPDAFNTMQAAVRFGNMTLSEFITSLNQAAPAARGAGYSFEDMSGTIAYLSRVFPSLRMGTTGYARLIETFARPDVRQGLRAHGVEITRNVHGTRQLIPLQEIAGRIFRRFGGDVQQGSLFLQNFFKEMGNTASTIQARRVLVALVRGYTDYRKVLHDTKFDNDELKKSLAAMEDTPAVKFQQFKLQLQALAITVGTQVLPIFAQLGGYLVSAVKWFQNLNPHTKETITHFLAWGGVILLVGGLLMTFVGFIASAIISVSIFTGARGLGGLASEAGFLSARMGLMLGGFTALLYIMYRFPGPTMQVVNALGGIQKVVEMIIGLTLAVKLSRWAAEVLKLGAFATVAAAEVGILEAALASLPVAGILIPIVVYIIWRKQITGAISDASNWVLKQTVGRFFDLGPGNKGFGAQRPWAAAFRFQGLTPVPGRPMLAMDANGRKYKWNPSKMRFEPFDDPTTGPISRVRIGTGRQLPEPHPEIKRQAQALAASYGAVATPTFQKLFMNLLNARKAYNRASANLEKGYTKERWNAYINASVKMQNAETAIETNASKQRAKAAKDAAELLTKTNKNGLNQQEQDFKDTMDSIMQMYDQIKQQQRGIYGSIFQGPLSALIQFRKQWGVLPRPVDLLGDIQGQNRRYRRFFSDIDKLRARGAPEQLIQQLQQAGIEALPEIEALTRMNSPMWQKYIAAFNTGQQMIERRTRIELRNQLKLYRKFGSDVGEAIRQGIADREPGLRKEIRSLVLQMFPELKTGGKETRKTSGAGTTNNTTNNYTESHPATYNTDGKGTRSLEAAQARQRRRIRDRSRGGNFGGPANQ